MTGIIIRGKQKVRVTVGHVTTERGIEIKTGGREWSCRAQAKEGRLPLEAGEGKEIDSSLEPAKGTQGWRPILDFLPLDYKRIYLLL